MNEKEQKPPAGSQHSERLINNKIHPKVDIPFDSGLSQHEINVLFNATPIRNEKDDALKSEFKISRAQRLFFEV